MQKIKIFLLVSPRSSRSSSSNERIDASTYLVDRERKRSKNGDDVVEHDVIRITGDPNTERTAPPRSTHVRNSHVSSFLIQQGREERLREMAPAAARRRGVDGAAVLRQSFAEHYGGGGGVGEGEGGNQRPRRSGMKSLLSPLYIGGPRGGGRP